MAAARAEGRLRADATTLDLRLLFAATRAAKRLEPALAADARADASTRSTPSAALSQRDGAVAVRVRSATPRRAEGAPAREDPRRRAGAVRQPLNVTELDLAEPQAGEVLVRLAACGVCHTDMYTASGVDPSGYAPTVLGHEGAGFVERVGEGVTSVAPGRPGRDAVLAAVPRVRSLPEPGHEPVPGDPRAAEPRPPARRHHPAVT